jgi:hypothetical protein
MATNLEIVIDKSTLGRVYAWLLSLNDGTPNAGELSGETVTETRTQSTTGQEDSGDTVEACKRS